MITRALLIVVAATAALGCASASGPEAQQCAELCDAAPLLGRGIDCEDECVTFAFDDEIDRCETEDVWRWASLEYAELGASPCPPSRPDGCEGIDSEAYEIEERFACE